MKNTIPIEGDFNQKHVTLDVYAEAEYVHNDYLDIVRLDVWSERRREMIPASERLLTKFLEAHWAYIDEKCAEYVQSLWETKRDERDYIGDMKCHEQREAA